MEKQIPLFWRLTPAAQAALIICQWDNHGELLRPAELEDTKSEWKVVLPESPEEIDKIMRQSRDVGR